MIQNQAKNEGRGSTDLVNILEFKVASIKLQNVTGVIPRKRKEKQIYF